MIIFGEYLVNLFMYDVYFMNIFYIVNVYCWIEKKWKFLLSLYILIFMIISGYLLMVLYF